MDIDDSFTEKLLQRNKARRRFVNNNEGEMPIALSKKRSALVDDQQILNKAPKESPKRSCEELPDDSPKRQCVEQFQGSPTRQWPPKKCLNESNEKENTPLDKNNEIYIPFKASFNVKGLAALRKNDNTDSSVINSRLTSQAEVGNDCGTYMFSTNSSELCSTGPKTRLANLAANINQWEDNLHKSTFSNNSVHTTVNNLSSSSVSKVCDFSNTLISAPLPTFQSDLVKQNDSNSDNLSKTSSIESDMSETITKKINIWEQAITATLENGEEKLSNKPVNVIKKVHIINEKQSNSGRCFTKNTVQNRSKLVGNEQVKNELNRSIDPAELPLSARKALFEQAINSGEEKTKEHSFEPKLSVAQRAAMFENACSKSSVSKPVLNYKSNMPISPKMSPSKSSKIEAVYFRSSPLKTLRTPEKTVINENVKSINSPFKSQTPEKTMLTKSNEGIRMSPIKKINTDTKAVEKMLLTRINSKVDVKETVIKPIYAEPKTNTNLVNYWEKLSASKNYEEEIKNQDAPKSETDQSEDDQDGYESDTESKYERESESEFNFNVPNTEEKFSESDQESDSPTEENVFKSPKGFPIASKTYNQNIESSTLKSKSNKNIISWQEDNFSEDSCDAVSLSDGSSYAESTISIDAQTVNTCQSFASSSSSVGSSYDPESSKESEENFTKSSCGSNCDSPLLYTVSFYRKQRQETKTPPLKTIVRREQVPTPKSSSETGEIQEQIKYLQEEIVKQQTVIGQTSQALNLCHATAEFSGSTEQVEGERLLLIATQKRQALLNEIQRLKTHGAEGGGGILDGTGTLTISDLQLPLKQEFLAAQLEGKINDAVHWFLCLIRYGAQVIVTQMVSTDDKVNNGALCFTNHCKLQNLPPDFSIVFEVYALQTKKESLPHEKKYHIRRDKSTMRLTPKGKKSENKLLLPAISSPGGPNAVRSPSFGVIGFTRFTIQNCNKKCFTLDKVPFTSPLDGVLRVKLHLHAEQNVMEKGFLTMFEDISGFGAWHRRWCALNAARLTYWKYPDDEHKKEPIGAIDLKQCVTAQVKPVSRDVCARSHTFQLVTVRPQEKGDKNNLTSRCVNTLTTTKHLLSADTKEERIFWCNKLNEALLNLRKWDPHALRPMKTND